MVETIQNKEQIPLQGAVMGKYQEISSAFILYSASPGTCSGAACAEHPEVTARATSGYVR